MLPFAERNLMRRRNAELRTEGKGSGGKKTKFRVWLCKESVDQEVA